MSVKVRVPLFDPNITEGVLASWRHRVGQTVQRGDVLVDLVTDKANFEIECPANGTLLAVTADEKSTVPVGTIIAVIGEPTETVPEVAQENADILAEHLRKAAVVQTATPQVSSSPAKQPVDRVRATPKARKLARQLGLDLAEVAKFVEGFRVTEKNVEHYAKNRKAE